jgi:high-affinity nickel-transport protein
MSIMSANLAIALPAAALLGFRHGFDYDHIAAISDVTSMQKTTRAAMRLGLLYAVGHAAIVAVLGGALVFLQLSFPPFVDQVAERVVGLTLVVLGAYVLAGLFRPGHTHMPQSRASLYIAGFRWMVARIQRWFGRQAPNAPQAPEVFGQGRRDAGYVFLIGVIHGLGAETPSQLLIFLLAMNLGGVSQGLLGLGMFLTGLLAMNTLMTASAAGIFGASTRRTGVRRAISTVTAAYSFVVGFAFLLGQAGRLPALMGR